jgi:hypothetical protein
MTESAKQRQANAIGAAKEYLRLSGEELAQVHGNRDRALGYALQGILRLQIELIEGQWDLPCDCSMGMPEPEDLRKIMGTDGNE